MNCIKDETQERMKVMQAFLDGKMIERRVCGTQGWVPVDSPHWNWVSNEYRVKQEFAEVSTRRFLARNRADTGYSIYTVNKADNWAGVAESNRNFIKWIDADWVHGKVALP